MQGPIRAVFCDLDGTLVHFERHFAKQGGKLHATAPDLLPGQVDFSLGDEVRRCITLPTSTMGPGVMSLRSCELIKELRQAGAHVVYVTGARCSTLMERLPLMAKVDAAFGETGGRFLRDECTVLDPAWTKQMEAFCGPSTTEEPPLQRKGVLWDWARALDNNGFEIDARSYFFGFRLDLSKQKPEMQSIESFKLFAKENLPSEITMTTNLGKFDFFPSVSGKGNAVRHYLALHGLKPDQAVALFDDENDLPMAEAVGSCFVLQTTHDSVTQALSDNPKWRLATKTGVLAAEEALSWALKLAQAPN
mmetsp:Transcript_9668/g.17004  ORF Transcript_9668/g.17004 Transcript_9668/m.17004 type:complete len:306 (+) Transcript_9668:119-1036(+)